MLMREKKKSRKPLKLENETSQFYKEKGQRILL